MQIGEMLLWVAALLTLVTGYDYLRAGALSYEPGAAPGRAAARGTVNRALAWPAMSPN